MNLNYLDLAAIAVILICAAVAFHKGFVKACLGFLPTVISLGAVYFLQPVVSKILRATPLYLKLRESASGLFGLDEMIANAAAASQSDLINQMNLPDFIKGALLENNNPVVYKILNVTEMKDYISGFIANICINILALILVFLAAMIAARLLLTALDLFSKLPVLSFVNKISGLCVGLVQGVTFLWIIGIAITFFTGNPKFAWLFDMMNHSVIAKPLYENNLLLFFVLKIFA